MTRPDDLRSALANRSPLRGDGTAANGYEPERVTPDGIAGGQGRDGFDVRGSGILFAAAALLWLAIMGGALVAVAVRVLS